MSVRVRSRKFFEEVKTPAFTPTGTEFPEDFGVYENLQPARESNIHSDVLVPLAQASITGTLIGASASAIFLLLVSKDTDVAVYIFSVTFVLVTAVVWMQLMRDRNQLLWKVERLTGKDFNGDGVVGEPETLRIELSAVNEHGFQYMETLDIPGSASKFREFACGVLSGRAISIASWTGQGGLYSKREFVALRDELLKRGWLKWRNPHAPAQGVTLTRKGRSALERICQNPPTPSGTDVVIR